MERTAGDATSELALIRAALARLQKHLDPDETGESPDEASEVLRSGEDDELPLSPVQFARLIYRFRRARDRAFGEIFGEPAWDILLDLYVAGTERRTVSVTSACIASASPQTTALRWLTRLSEEGLIERRVDPADARRIYVQLTTRGRETIDTQLRAMLRTLAAAYGIIGMGRENAPQT